MDKSALPRRRFLLGSLGMGLVVGNSTLITETAHAGGYTGTYKPTSDNNSTTHKGTRLSPIIRDFSDPLLELLRLLQEGAEIEQDLMIQYLYAGFSLKPAYADLTGYGDPNAKDFLGVAVQEMQHLGAVNRLLVALGSDPVLKRHDFPYEVDIYPFPFELVPCSRNSIAHYMYCEAPKSALDPLSGDPTLLLNVASVMGSTPRPNFVGSLYQQILDLTYEVEKDSNAPKLDWGTWREKLHHIMEEGEDDHFEFFKSVFMGTHPVMKKVGASLTKGTVWDLPKTDERYPSFQIVSNPTAYYGHPNAIENREALKIAWIGNLLYWIAMGVLDRFYRGHFAEGVAIAQEIMLAAILPLAKHIPSYGYGMPFDPLSMSYHGNNAILLKKLCFEADKMIKHSRDALPSDFDTNFAAQLAERIS